MFRKIAFELSARHGIQCTVIDPRPMKVTKDQERFYNLKRYSKKSVEWPNNIFLFLLYLYNRLLFCFNFLLDYRSNGASILHPQQIQCLFDDSFLSGMRNTTNIFNIFSSIIHLSIHLYSFILSIYLSFYLLEITDSISSIFS